MAIHILEVESITNKPRLLHPNWKSNSAEFWESQDKASFFFCDFHSGTEVKTRMLFHQSKNKMFENDIVLVDKTIKRSVFATDSLNALEKCHKYVWAFIFHC